MKLWQILLIVSIALGGVGFLAVQSMGEGDLYAHVEQVVKDPAKHKNRTIKVMGVAHKVPVLLYKQRNQIEFELESTEDHSVIKVRHNGLVPDTFKNMAETVVRGTLSEENGQLVITTSGDDGILAKCASRYKK